LVNSLGFFTAVFREDTTFATGRAQAANNTGRRFGSGLILGFAVGDELAWRSSRYGYTRDRARSLRHYGPWPKAL
jgi:hypothetical protein